MAAGRGISFDPVRSGTAVPALAGRVLHSQPPCRLSFVLQTAPEDPPLYLTWQVRPCPGGGPPCSSGWTRPSVPTATKKPRISGCLSLPRSRPCWPNNGPGGRKALPPRSPRASRRPRTGVGPGPGGAGGDGGGQRHGQPRRHGGQCGPAPDRPGPARRRHLPSMGPPPPTCLALSSFILLGGALGDQLGRRKVFVIGTVWFAASSAVRRGPRHRRPHRRPGLQGVGAALLTPGSLAILQASFRPSDRAAAVGAWSGLGSGAGAIGPLAGGGLVDGPGGAGSFSSMCPWP